MKNILVKIFILIYVSFTLNALDMNDAIKRALDNNNNLKKQQYIYEEKEKNVDLYKSSFKPNLDFAYMYEKNHTNKVKNKESASASIFMTYNLFNGFKDKYNLESSQDILKNSKYIFEASRLDLIYNTKSLYIQYLKSVKNIDTMLFAYKLLQQQYSDASNKFEQGLLAKNDLLQVNALKLQAKQNLSSAEANKRIAWFKLKNLLGNKLKKDEEIQDIKREKVSLSTYKFDNLELKNEIKAMNMTIQSLKKQQKSALSSSYAKVDLKLAYSKFGKNIVLDKNKNTPKDQTTSSINIKWNLYNGSKDQIQNIIFNKKIMQIKEDLINLKLTIHLEYETALEEFNVSTLNFKTSQLFLIQSLENYKIVYARFKEGISTTTDLVNANYLLIQAKQSINNAYYDKVLAKAKLDRIFEI